MSPKRTNRPDSGLADLPDEEISRRARDRSLSGPERNKYREEEKVRGLRNKQKRKNYKRIDTHNVLTPICIIQPIAFFLVKCYLKYGICE